MSERKAVRQGDVLVVPVNAGKRRTHLVKGGTFILAEGESTGHAHRIGHPEVVNRTPEPDGTFKHYILPVHPQLRPLPDPDEMAHSTTHGLGDPTRVGFGEPQAMTARNAVASTFGTTGEQYEEMLGAES